MQVPAHANMSVGKNVEDPGYYRLPGYAESVGRINLRAILEARQVREGDTHKCVNGSACELVM